MTVDNQDSGQSGPDQNVANPIQSQMKNFGIPGKAQEKAKENDKGTYISTACDSISKVIETLANNMVTDLKNHTNLLDVCLKPFEALENKCEEWSKGEQRLKHLIKRCSIQRSRILTTEISFEFNACCMTDRNERAKLSDRHLGSQYCLATVYKNGWLP
jgi:hypothetical protein